MTPSRRTFLEAAGASLTLGPSVGIAAARQARRPRVAALASTYHYLSHAYHIVGRFLDGFVVHDGRGLHRPDFEIASLYIEQTPEATDLGRGKARRFDVRLSPTIADALTLGTGTLAVDAVLLIAEHGDYPYNAKLQKLYPRGIYFREVLDVFRTSGRSVPVFVDKHLSYDRAEAATMVDRGGDAQGPIDGRVEPARDLATAADRGPARTEMDRGRRRLARRDRGLRLPRARDPAVHGRAARHGWTRRRA